MNDAKRRRMKARSATLAALRLEQFSKSAVRRKLKNAGAKAKAGIRRTKNMMEVAAQVETKARNLVASRIMASKVAGSGNSPLSPNTAEGSGNPPMREREELGDDFWRER